MLTRDAVEGRRVRVRVRARARVRAGVRVRVRVRVRVQTSADAMECRSRASGRTRTRAPCPRAIVPEAQGRLPRGLTHGSDLCWHVTPWGAAGGRRTSLVRAVRLTRGLTHGACAVRGIRAFTPQVKNADISVA